MKRTSGGTCLIQSHATDPALSSSEMTRQALSIFPNALPWLFFFFFLQASKVFITGNQIAPKDSWEGEAASPSLLSYRGFYPLKMGVTNVGSKKMWFSPIGLALSPVLVLVQYGP